MLIVRYVAACRANFSPQDSSHPCLSAHPDNIKYRPFVPESHLFLEECHENVTASTLDVDGGEL